MKENESANSVVSVRSLVKRYGDILALDHFNLEIGKGEIFGLLGPNGCGKTTAINCMLQLLVYDKGDIELFGEAMKPTRYDLKRRIGVVPQQVAVFDELTVFENIDCFCALYVSDKTRRRQLVEEAIEFVGLEDYRKMRPKKLSGGLLRRLNIACGIAHKPELIFFDEPTVAVDPQSRNAILDGIVRLRDEGATVVYTSHYMEEVEQICSRIMIMDGGKILALGTADELKRGIAVGEKIVIELPGAVLRLCGGSDCRGASACALVRIRQWRVARSVRSERAQFARCAGGAQVVARGGWARVFRASHAQ